MKNVRDELQNEKGNLRVAIDWAVLHWDEEEVRKVFNNISTFYQVCGWHEGADGFGSIVRLLKAHGAGIDPDSTKRAQYLSAVTHHGFFISQLGDSSLDAVQEKSLPILRDLGYDPEFPLCLFNLGVSACFRGKYEEGIQFLGEVDELLNETHEEYLVASNLSWLGWAYYELGDYDRAGEEYEKAYQVSKRKGHLLGMAYTMSKLGTWADALQNHAKAKEYHQEAQQTFVEFGNPAGQGYALSRMSLSAWGLGEYEEAKRYAREGLEQFESINHRWGVATSYCRMGFAERGLGEHHQAERHFYEGLIRSKEHGIVSTMIYALIGFGCLRASEGEREPAVELLTLALNHPVTPGLYKDIAQRELEQLRERLPADEFEAAEERGREGDFEAAVEAVLREQSVE
jgi:tetratricopeptide (TPR) repeat protein